MKPAIVISAYNRPDLLFRLLSSIEKAYGLQGAVLVVSLDYCDEQDEIKKLLSKYHWPYGDFEVITHSANIGLREHILFCGNLTETYSSIILLEEDLFVSPFFYLFAMEASEFYRSNESISGVSLYNHSFNETAQMKFEKLQDCSDVYFLQIASSWGQVWTREQWFGFRSWYDKNKCWEDGLDKLMIPNDVMSWPDSSWKRHFIKYNVQNNLYFVYPKVSLTTNFSDMGTHHKRKQPRFQVPLMQQRRTAWDFIDLKDSNLVYDAFCELKPSRFKRLCGRVELNVDVAIDIFGCKPLEKIGSRYLVSTKRSSEPINSFALNLKPKELNVIYSLDGRDIFFAETESFSDEKLITPIDEREYYFGLPSY